MHLPDGWRSAALGELLRQTDYGVSVPLFDSGKIPVLRMMNLVDGRIDLADLRYSDSREAQSLQLRLGDVLFNRTNSMRHVGRTSLWRDELPAASFASYCVRFVCRESEIDPAYLVWHMNLPQVQTAIKRLATPAVQQVNVNPTRLRELLEIQFPRSLDKQRDIVKVLDATVATIRQTETVIAKLRNMKAGLLHDLLTSGLDEQGRLRNPQRHPEQFKDSPLGRIPKEWDVTTVGQELRSIEGGHSPDCPDTPAPEGIWGVLKVSAIQPDVFVPGENKVITNMRMIDPTCEVHDSDLLISRSNTYQLVGLACVASPCRSMLMLCDKTLRLCPIPSRTSERFLVQVLASPAIRKQIENRATGTSGSMKNISQDSIRALLLALPPLPEQARIIAVVEAQKDRLRAEEAHLGKLKLQKRGLMHDLLTGRVRV